MKTKNYDNSNEERFLYFLDVKELILKEVENVPEPHLIEVLDFARFLETTVLKEKMELAIASETSLKKDWLKHEEDEAWKDL